MPKPLALVTLRVKRLRIKLAVTVRAAFMVTVQVVPATVSQALQPLNMEARSGVAVKVTTVPLAYEAEQVAPQSIPGGLEVTVPLPVPALLTVRLLGARAVLLISTETLSELKLPTARSCLTSPLKSPTATEAGLVPALKACAAWNVPSPLPSSTETVLGPRMLKSKLATARSGCPSLLTSPTAMERGPVPVLKFRGAWNVPSPLPSSTETSLERKLATARSGRPSPLTSPTATEAGVIPTSMVRAA